MIGRRIVGFGVFAIGLLLVCTAQATQLVPVLGLPTVMTTGEQPPAATSGEAPASIPSTASATDDATTVPTDNAQCFPACRAGFLCHSGQCVSRCNPACAEGFECTEALTCVSPTSKTEPAEPALPPKRTASPDDDRPRYHDGFYLQLALGLMAAGGEAKGFDDGSGKIDFVGSGPRVHTALGFTVANGLVIGGLLGLEGHELRVKDTNDDLVFAADSATTDLLAFSDWYFMPDFGFHGQLALGPSFISLKGDGAYFPDRRFAGAGLTALLGVGLQGYISDKWGFGALFQVQAHGMRMEAISSNEDFELGYGSASLLFSATYH